MGKASMNTTSENKRIFRLGVFKVYVELNKWQKLFWYKKDLNREYL